MRYTPYPTGASIARSRWLSNGCSCLVGALAGIAFLLFVSSTGVKVIQSLAQLPSGQPAVTVVVQEDYLNSEASKQINGNYPTGVDGLTVTALNVDVNPDNRLDLRADFKVNVGFFNFATSAGITNHIS